MHISILSFYCGHAVDAPFLRRRTLSYNVKLVISSVYVCDVES